MKTNRLVKRAIVIGIAGAMVLSEALPAFAGPVPSSTAIVKASAPDMIDHVRSRRSQRVGAGIALGVIGALVGAAAVQNEYYYGSPGYYGGGAMMEVPAITNRVTMGPPTTGQAITAATATILVRTSRLA